MVEACRAHRVRLMIAIRKYSSRSVALKKLVVSAKLGRSGHLSTYTEICESGQGANLAAESSAGRGGIADGISESTV